MMNVVTWHTMKLEMAGLNGELQWRMSDSAKPGDKSLYILHDRICIYMREVCLLQSPGLANIYCLFVLGFSYEHSRHTRQSVQKKLVASLQNVHEGTNNGMLSHLELQCWRHE